MRSEPLLLLFGDDGLVTYVCYACGIIETRNCKNDKKFKSFIKEKTNKNNECLVCSSSFNLFKDPHGQQYWINNKNS